MERRRELDQSGVETFTIVAEYVVDLAFSFSVDTAVVNNEPSVLSYPFGDARNADDTGDILTVPGARPQRVRTVRYRVATRSRETDRDSPADDGGPGLLRYALGAPPSVEYARVRTVIGEVSLINHQGIRW